MENGGAKSKKSRAPREKGGCKTIKSGQNLHTKKQKIPYQKFSKFHIQTINSFRIAFNPVNDSK